MVLSIIELDKIHYSTQTGYILLSPLENKPYGTPHW